MLASISPFGERARGQRWGVTVAAYVVGSTAGGALVGGALGALGAVIELPATARLGAVAAVAVLGLALDVARGRAHAHAPGPQRQVDENWLSTYRGWVYGAGFGLQLGAAFTTIVPSSITYVAFACALLSQSVVGGVVVGVVFGVVRALPLLSTRRVHDPASLRDVMRRVDAALPRARVAVLAAYLVTAGVAIAGVVHSAVGA